MTADLAAKRKWSPDDAFFTPADRIVLEVLYRDLNSPSPQDATPDEAALRLLTSLNNPQHPNFQPTIFASWDLSLQSPRNIPEWFLQRYVSWARTVVRHQTDVVFVSHLIIYFLTIVPSAVYLFHHFTWLHAAVHLPYTLWCAGAFTLVMHNHIHNNGILAPGWKWFDYCFPYLLEPLMGHTWNSYYYHHIKAHHVESNGPSDPSSTLRYQRDSILHFLHYLFRFLVLGWWDLGSYFWGKGRRGLAVKAVGWNFLDFAAIVALARWKLAPTITVFILPMCFLRVGLMAGNWGQHAFVDDLEPDSDFRSSITVIDVASNRFCFNDGYHTSHHLNPKRHWRDHPHAFLTAKERYEKEGALVFQNIDYLEVTFRLMTGNYASLARRLVPLGSQAGMSQKELEVMLRRKTRAFGEEEIRKKFKL